MPFLKKYCVSWLGTSASTALASISADVWRRIHHYYHIIQLSSLGSQLVCVKLSIITFVYSSLYATNTNFMTTFHFKSTHF